MWSLGKVGNLGVVLRIELSMQLIEQDGARFSRSSGLNKMVLIEKKVREYI